MLVIFLKTNYQLSIIEVIIQLIIDKFSFGVQFQCVFLLIVMLFELLIIEIGNHNSGNYLFCFQNLYFLELLITKITISIELIQSDNHKIVGLF